MIKDDFNQLAQRTRRYWFTDGLAELVAGAAFLLLGLYFYLQAVLPADSLLLSLLQAGFVLVFIGSMFLGKRVVRMLKDRLTYQRTGYVAYPPPERKHRWISAGFAIVMAALVAGLIVSFPSVLDWVSALTGLIVAVFWIVTAARVGVLRFYGLALVSFLFGIVYSLAGSGEILGIAYFYTSMGFVMLISGGIVLFLYLRDNPSR
jgi:hypothetical protein